MPFVAVFHPITLMVTTRTSGRVPTILKRIYTDLRNPASFSSLVQGSKMGDTPNKVQGRDRVVGNTEVIYPAPEGENKTWKEESCHPWSSLSISSRLGRLFQIEER